MPTLPLRLETDVQTKMVNTVNDELGGHAFKASNRFRLGIPDLSVQLPSHAHCFIEIKYMRDGFVRGNEAALHLTPHQRRFIVDHVAAGGCAGWCMVVALGNDAYALDFSMRIPSSGVVFFDTHPWLIKKRGEPWPMELVVKSLQR